MTNQFKHIDALEYAEGFKDGLKERGAFIEQFTASWHKARERAGTPPTSYQLAYLRGLEAAAITLDKGPASSPIIEIVTLDQSGDDENTIDGIKVEKFYPDNAARIRGGSRRG